MANEHEDSYHGYRYLVDATNSRQYALRFDNGKPGKPLHVFAEDQRHAAVKPNEIIFAMDDETETVSTAAGTFISTVAFQITMNDNAEPKGLKKCPVNYQVIFGQDGDKSTVHYLLTPESIQMLGEEGFDTKFPRSFKDTLGNSTGGSPMGPDMLGMMPFPPHHNSSAYIARENIESLSAETTSAQSHQDEEPAMDDSFKANNPRPANDFNKAATPVAPPPVKYKHSDAEIEGVIKMFTKDYSALAAQGRLDPVVGRDKEIEQALKVMTRRKQSSLCFTGEAGVGKSAMFIGVAQRINDDNTLPESLHGARVLALDLEAMNAGAKFRGQFEEKLKPLIDGLQEREGILKGRKIILAIDEIHSQLTAGKAEGGTDSGNMMKPFLTGIGISVMGTSTDQEYKKHIEKDPALASRFEKMRLDPPNEKDTVTIIKRLWPLTKAHNHLTEDMTDAEINYIVTMTNRYAPQEAQPRKAEKVMNMAASGAEFDHRSTISRKDILGAVAQMSKLPVDFLDQSDHEKFLKLETELPKEVLGQPGLQSMIDGLIGARSGLTDANQPWGCFVMQGPTGTGKTEACKALARHLFGTEDALIQINMAQYAEKHAVSGLIGAPPGFVGFDSAEPALTEKIRQRPYSILLLDEIEKAHPDVFNVLLPILNDGKMTDNQGNVALFNNVIIVMTSNAGASKATALLAGKSDAIGFGGSRDANAETTEKELTAIYAKARTIENGGPFRPEMIGRIEELGGFITFRPLAPEVIEKLVVRELSKVNERLSSAAGANIKGVELQVSDDVKAQLAAGGYDPTKGARDLKGFVRRKIQNQIGKWLMNNKEELVAFVAKNGTAKLVVDSLDVFTPKLVKADVAEAAEVSATNDNAAPERKVTVTIKKRRKPQGPGTR